MSKPIVTVKVRKGDINRALKIFERAVMNSGHIFENKDRQEYTKPTNVRRREKQVGIRKQESELMKKKERERPNKKKKKKR